MKVTARNEACPCGSGKKYKRCHGVDAPPALTERKEPANPSLPQGFDPSTLDPEWISQFSKMMSKLPKGQLGKLQGLMQKAMSGKDIQSEAQGFEETLPVELQQMLLNSPWAKQLGEGELNAGASQEVLNDASVSAEAPSKLKKFFSKFSKS